MKLVAALTLMFVTTGFGVAQYRSDDPKLRELVNRMQQAWDAQDPHAYSLLFADNSSWDGPQGQSALGQQNIERAAQLLFREIGPLTTSTIMVRQLSPEVMLIDVYQGSDGLSRDVHVLPPVSVAPGSGSPRMGEVIRSTLIVKRYDDTWQIAYARIADLRTHSGPMHTGN